MSTTVKDGWTTRPTVTLTVAHQKTATQKHFKVTRKHITFPLMMKIHVIVLIIIIKVS